jgi:hypothetical protein
VERDIVISPEEVACPECRRLRRMCVIRPIDDQWGSGQARILQYQGIPFTSEKEEKLFEEHLSAFHKMVK